MRDDEVGGLCAGAKVMVHGVVSAPPKMAGYPHIDRLEPAATGNGVWVDFTLGKFKHQIWVPAAALEAV